VYNHKIFFGYNRSRFILQRRGKALDEIEEAVATGLNMSAVLDVVGRPIARRRFVVPLIKQRVKGFKDKRFIFRFDGLINICSPILGCIVRSK
jgi:hypothetical protein